MHELYQSNIGQKENIYIDRNYLIEQGRIEIPKFDRFHHFSYTSALVLRLKTGWS